MSDKQKRAAQRSADAAADCAQQLLAFLGDGSGDDELPWHASAQLRASIVNFSTVLRADNCPPEKALVRIKELIAASHGLSATRATELSHAAVTWAIEAYYDTPITGTRPDGA